MEQHVKLRVLHIITRLDPGGSSTNTIETVARLDPERFEVFLISGRTKDDDGTIEASLKARNIAYVFYKDLQREINIGKDIKAFLKLYRFLKDRPFDIVHTHSSKAGVLGRWAAKCAVVPVIIHTPHGHIFYGYFSKWMTTIFIWIERLTARITDKIITLTQRGKEEHVHFKIAPPDKFVTIHSGIDINPKVSHQELKAHLKKQWVLNEGYFIFGSVGRLDPIKGTSYLIEAMALLVKKYPKSQLLLVGEGSQRERLKKQCINLGLGAFVKFTGYQKDPAPFIEIMDVFILPSLNEGMGRVILEAMTYGKPVIATKVGGIPELVEDGKNGILVNPQDPHALAQAMIRLANDKPLLDRMSHEAILKVGDQFNINRMVRDIEDLYQQLANKPALGKDSPDAKFPSPSEGRVREGGELI